MAGWALFCNSRARPASKISERVKLLNCPGHGTGFGKPPLPAGIAVSEGYLQGKDLQKVLFSIFCLPFARARKAVYFPAFKPHAEDHTVACGFGPQGLEPRSGFRPDRHE